MSGHPRAVQAISLSRSGCSRDLPTRLPPYCHPATTSEPLGQQRRVHSVLHVRDVCGEVAALTGGAVARAQVEAGVPAGREHCGGAVLWQQQYVPADRMLDDVVGHHDPVVGSVRSAAR